MEIITFIIASHDVLLSIIIIIIIIIKSSADRCINYCHYAIIRKAVFAITLL
jgi:hypothetical protein